MTYEVDFDAPLGVSYELVPVAPDPEGTPLPDDLRPRILIDTVHDGEVLPRAYRDRPDGSPRVPYEEVTRRFVRERDWGANRVAGSIAAALGLEGFYRVRPARVLLDFNRFPGTTSHEEHLERLSINPPFANGLDHELKMRLLSDLYDGISTHVEAALQGKLIKIGIHTYDEHNASTTQRPDVSLLTLAAGYQRDSRMPLGVFDPLYPDALAESTCSRVLRDRISLNLERSGYRVSHNHPYPLPEGSVEVRAQVWFFFNYLRERYEADHPQAVGDAGYAMVWQMLLNTNLRLMESTMLRAYLHHHSNAPDGQAGRYRDAQSAYERISRYVEESTVVTDYRRSAERPGALAIEVRKDLLCELDPATGGPLREVPDAARALGRVIAGAISIYFDTDRRR
ncbi:MAG: N-formylglutamate amidohydrolase [Planctomycetota bacterium]|jgi:hypothetical protein